MKIDIWSDIVCPFCYIGKRRLEAALEGFEHRDEIEIVWHSFELDPNAPVGSGESTIDHVATKYGMTIEQARQNSAALADQAATVGLTFNYEDAVSANTFDAHRLVHLGAATSPQAADDLEERLMRTFFTQGLAIDDHDVLRGIAREVGLDTGEVDALLASDRFADEVRADEQAARGLGISGVPFFVFAEKYAISGAQPLEVFEQALNTAWVETRPAPFAMVSGSGEGTDAACGPDGCTI